MDHDQFSFTGPFYNKYPQTPKYAHSLRIMTTIQGIRARNGWREQLKNSETIDAWRAEAMENGLKRKEIDAVVDQLKYFDSLSSESVEVGLVEGTRWSNSLISAELKNEFVAAVTNFQAKFGKKDYDPGTDNLVVNILDPRLYCFATHISRVADFDLNLQNCLQVMGGGKSIEEFYCNNYRITEPQLLPAEFHVNESGEAKVNSYINNLHPEFDADLYALIERIFTCFVPLFNGVLHDLLHDRPKDAYKYLKKPKLEVSYATTKTYLNGRDIQVIVGMKSIELSPEKPEFNDDDWHIEGVKKERIVASGIYCFHTENISESCVELRGKHQEMGSLATGDNSSISFPNIFQHRIGAFKLEDASKPGFWKVLVFSLVDPTYRTVSTRKIPPQQLNWFEEKLLQIPPFNRLDAYLLRKITSFLECPYTLQEAKANRDLLIKWKKEDRWCFSTD